MKTFLMILGLMASILVPSTSSAQWAVDSDKDGVSDADDQCNEIEPVNQVDIQFIGEDGCWLEGVACVQHRLQSPGAGDSAACPAPVWEPSQENLAIALSLDYRQKRDGATYTGGAGTLTVMSGSWSCIDSQEWLYVRGNRVGGERRHTSAFGPEQPPFCSRIIMDPPGSGGPVTVVKRVGGGVSKTYVEAEISSAVNPVDEAAQEALRRVQQLEQRPLGADAEQQRKNTRAIGTNTRSIEVLGDTIKGEQGRIDNLDERVTKLENQGDRPRLLVGGGLTFSSFNLVDKELGSSGFHRHVDPSLALRVQGGVSALKGAFYLDGSVFIDLGVFGRPSGEYKMGNLFGVGGNATAGGVIAKRILIGGSVEGSFRTHNPGRDWLVNTEMGTFAPGITAGVFLGEQRRLVLKGTVQPQFHSWNWSDGTYGSTGTGRPPTFGANIVVGYRF